jgi:predicted Rossmann fold flavoprotein
VLPPVHCDAVIAGAGAAGLATAIFAKRAASNARILLLDSSARPGAKILVSGGSRCNVTNTRVVESDFWGGRRTIIRRVLRAFPVPDTVDWFRQLGVPLHEEPGGKLFPDSNRSRDVLDALLRERERCGVELLTSARVESVERTTDGFRLTTTRGAIDTARLVLATGGRSLPKTGSDGGGYALASSLGHRIIDTTPALAPLLLDDSDTSRRLRSLSGVSADVELSAWIDGAIATRLRGALLFTHFGISGPVALNVSRIWARARLDARPVAITMHVWPDERHESIETIWLEIIRQRPRATARALLPSALADGLVRALIDLAGIADTTVLADLTRDQRRRLLHLVTACPLPIVDTRGYNYAEVTAGGVDLAEIDPATMGSRVCDGLYLVGEILDVDGRIGGFNFQWAWASARVAATALARSIGE